MGLWLQLQKNITKGSVTGLLGASLIGLFSFVLIASLNWRILNLYQQTGENAVVAAALAGLAASAPEDMAYGEYVLDKERSSAVIKEALAVSLNLDSELKPLSSEAAISEVCIEELRIYNPQDREENQACSYGTAIRETTIHLVVSYRVGLKGLPGPPTPGVLIRIHQDVDNHYQLQ